ncbi:alpha-amylase [Rubrobacter taiwanensis]|jgi:amylosucrase|uniref:Alpha-amylase n=1 Tax=Rubrobacter taiwanensis TaxID=185139 RepID=A0A4R1BRH7_9ACTN|nr:amylosucrase [Rubrobacter taiwanensis]TCJ20208.1 alpha-amylase [Rubrobacter taiwanensis]
MTPEARAAFERAAGFARSGLAELPRRDAQIFLLRLERYWQDLYDGLIPPYGEREAFDTLLEQLVRLLAGRYAARPEELKVLDLERTLTPDWFQRETQVGYVFYVDRFAGDLRGVEERLAYLEELGISYVHLMPLLKTRPGENDGGYAVADYRAVEPRLGTLDDLERLCRRFRERGISACTDLVLNHCAAEHEWAVRARRGEEEYRDMFYIFPDRTLPDAYERTLPEVFPQTSPGNFTRIEETGEWVWTTFHSFQWDLNWANPRVFLEMLDILLELANRGVEILRLDAVAFMWKRPGTDCQNQPEVHALLQALRACARIAAPAVIFKAEAIVGPDDLIHYLGTRSHYGKVSDLAYHNSLMVHYWSSLASRDTRLMTHTLGEFPEKPPATAWATYLRCHDDIGWAITEEDAAAVGLDGFAHRSFLSDYYSGRFPGSHARGAVFQPDPETADRRISGTLASLNGLELALETEDPLLLEMSLRRILLGYALIFGYDGIPLIYMGDEIGLLNDYTYKHRGDNRWMHRPFMDWEKAERRNAPGSVEQRLFGGIRRLIEARKRTPHLHAATPARVVDSGNPHLFAYTRPHPLGTLLAVHNFTEAPQSFGDGLARRFGIRTPFDRIELRPPEASGDTFRLGPYQSVWITDL